MISPNCLPAWIVSAAFVAGGATTLGQSSEERSATDSSAPAFSIEGERIASWPSDPWMTASRERQIFDALQQEWPLPHLHEERLNEVIRSLGETSGDVPFRIDRRSLEEIGLTADIPITFDQQGISVGGALQSILHDLDLTFQVSGGAVIITTRETAEASLVIRVYDVTPLVSSARDQMQRHAPDWYRLGELIQTTVAPDTWEMLGGPSSLVGRVVGDRTLLVIPTTTEVHFQIDALLNRLNMAGFATSTHGSRYSGTSVQRHGSRMSESSRVPPPNPRLPRFGE